MIKLVLSLSKFKFICLGSNYAYGAIAGELFLSFTINTLSAHQCNFRAHARRKTKSLKVELAGCRDRNGHNAKTRAKTLL